MIEKMFLFKEIQLGVYTHMLVSAWQLELCMYSKQYDKKFKNIVQLLLVNFTNYNYLDR